MPRAPHPHRERARQLRREGQPLSQIAKTCGVSHVAVSKWCRNLPEHQEAVERNTAAVRANRRIYPAGTRPFVNKLLAAGTPAAERLRLAQQVAAADQARREA